MPFLARRFIHFLALSVAALLLMPSPSYAQEWPARPIKIIIPYPPGGQTDIVARWIGEKLSAVLGQPFVMDNRPGAQAIVGITAAKQSPGDGYTLVMVNSSNIIINKFAYTKLAYDGLTDFETVAHLGMAPLGMVVPTSSGIKSVDEFVQQVKRAPGKATFASFGTGSSSHLYGEMLKGLTKTDMVHVPYKGAGPAVVDIASGQATMGIQDFAATAPFIQSGKLTLLATTGPKRWPLHPDVKTFGELGYSAMNLAGWVGIMAPKGTPKPIIDRLNREINKAIQSPEGTAKILQLGLLVTGMTPAEFTEDIRRATPLWGDIFKQSGIVPE
jgi:tripartite-type tricarboxylate transporter receptor subunit TctC